MTLTKLLRIIESDLCQMPSEALFLYLGFLSDPMGLYELKKRISARLAVLENEKMPHNKEFVEIIKKNWGPNA